jgi:hypothetical protein
MPTIRQSIAALNRPSTPEEIAERIRYRRIGGIVTAEVKAKYPVLTGDNFEAAEEYRQARWLHHQSNQED